VTRDDWDRFVAANPLATHLQASPWATVKAPNGWASTLVVDEAAGSTIGAQILLRRPRLIPWTFAYAPRGPIAERWSPDALVRWTGRLRTELRADPRRISHVRIDPGVELDGPDDRDGATRVALRELGWRPAPPVQPTVTRIIDLAVSEDELWAGVKRKTRYLVRLARREVHVEDVDGDRLADFYRVVTETAERKGRPVRALSAYRAVWDAFRPAGMARLLFAVGADGEPQGALILVRWGSRVVASYGGMNATGARTFASYLLYWESIRTSREQGATTYDWWGLINPGIAHFKSRFGGREVRTIGAWDLDLAPVGAAAYRLAERLSGAQRRRQRGSLWSPTAGSPSGDAQGAAAGDDPIRER
jgi:lipid II:glycine glycyltransferase (peptidoglycan interpeptide bridge formation enzyme)